MSALKMDTIKKISMQVLGVGILVVALVGFMGTYFWMSYRGEQPRFLFRRRCFPPMTTF